MEQMDTNTNTISGPQNNRILPYHTYTWIFYIVFIFFGMNRRAGLNIRPSNSSTTFAIGFIESL